DIIKCIVVIVDIANSYIPCLRSYPTHSDIASCIVVVVDIANGYISGLRCDPAHRYIADRIIVIVDIANSNRPCAGRVIADRDVSRASIDKSWRMPHYNVPRSVVGIDAASGEISRPAEWVIAAIVGDSNIPCARAALLDVSHALRAIHIVTAAPV